MANGKMRLTLCTLGLFTIAAVIAPSAQRRARLVGNDHRYVGAEIRSE